MEKTVSPTARARVVPTNPEWKGRQRFQSPPDHPRSVAETRIGNQKSDPPTKEY